jgi:hypothetical protein
LLVEAEVDVVQLAAASLRWLDAAGDALKTQAWVMKDDLDRIHALGGAPRARTAATNELCEFRAQAGMQILDKSHGEGATFAFCEAQPRVRVDGQLDATADQFAIAAGVGRAGAPPAQRVVSGRETGACSRFQDGCQMCRGRRSVAVHDLSLSLAMLLAHDATTLTYNVGQAPGLHLDTFWTPRT